MYKYIYIIYIYILYILYIILYGYLLVKNLWLLKDPKSSSAEQRCSLSRRNISGAPAVDHVVPLLCVASSAISLIIVCASCIM